jgi:hypothetical protein
MDDRFTAQQTAMGVVRADRMRCSCQKLCKRGWYAAKSGRVNPLTIISPEGIVRKTACWIGGVGRRLRA